jgi:hypothetical protein
LSDGEFDRSETSFFVSGRDGDLLRLGDVLGKRLKACRGRFSFKHESEEPSCQAQDDQEKYESNQEDKLSKIQSSSTDEPQTPSAVAITISVQQNGMLRFSGHRNAPILQDREYVQPL